VTAEVYRHDAALWRMDLRAQAPHFEKLQTIPHSDSRHRVSPDGRRVVFVSRGGLWISDLNGSNARLVADHSEVILNPRFSSDGRWIAFSGNPAQSNADLRSRLYVVAADGGIPRRLLPKLDDVSFSNWSRDGKWLYVSREDLDLQSDTKPQLWRVNLASGELFQITKNGGIAAEESADEGWLFYTTPYYPKLYRVPISGGMETQLTKTGLSAVFGGAFAVAKGSIFFVPDVRGDGKAPILKFNLSSSAEEQVAATDLSPLTLQLSPDERFLFATSDPPAKQVRVIIDGLR
jgi:Tol biopolymer transport system component